MNKNWFKRMKNRDLYKKILKFFVFLVVILIIANNLNFENIISEIQRIEPFYFVLFLVMAFFNVFLWAISWKILIEKFNDVSMKKSLKIGLIVPFIGQILPARVSRVLGTPLVLKKKIKKTTNSIATAVTITNTILYSITYALICLLGVLLLRDKLPIWLLTLLVFSGLIYLVPYSLYKLGDNYRGNLDYFLDLINYLVGLIPFIKIDIKEKASDFVDKTLSKSSILLEDKKIVFEFILVFIFSLSILTGLRVWFLLKGMEASINIFILFFAPTMAYSISIIPITPGGIGIAELTAIFVFVSLGIPKDIAGSVILLDRIFSFYLPSLIGGIFFLKS
ncbi:hypothetical protein C9439_04025 [archaeon SCG-AAA382B04]|nr:hypothetical protein C9439_04025 [archaeon SCG-AAA382B04]